jgi:thiosulfate reductase cytochrome b subunit
MEKTTVLYSRFERFWHWTQAVFIIILAVTGFEVHGTFRLLGFREAFELHNFSAWSLVVLTAFAIFWHFTTGEWKQYVPTFERVKDMLRFYTRDMFHGAPHPVKRNRDAKLNPLQRLTYFSLKTLVIPLQVSTGFLYLWYNFWPQWGTASRLDAVALAHTAGAFAFLAFLVVHMYLTTTGDSPLSNIRAMITGWDKVEEGSAERPTGR